MKKMYIAPVMLAIAALLAACGSTPKTTTLLEQTRVEYAAAQNNPKIATYAAIELRQAGEILAQANAQADERNSDESIDKFAYLAKQKIALSHQVANKKVAETEIANASRVRDQLLIDQRTNEANAADIRAAAAQRATQAAQQDAMHAKQQTQLAQTNADQAQRQVEQARLQNALLESQLAALAAKKTDRGMVITLGDVLFGTDLARLSSQGQATVQKLAQVLKDNPQRNVLVEGFTDSTGDAAYNQGLSERRARVVQATLLDMGVPQGRVAVNGLGEAYPVAANDTEENRSLNRRVEIVLSDDTGKVLPR